MEGTVLRDGLYGFEMKAHDPDQRRQYDREKRTGWDIKQLWQRSHEIIDLAIRGIDEKSISQMLGISHWTVKNTLNSELGMQKLSELRKERDKDAVAVGEEIEKLTKKALNTYHEIFDSPAATLKLKKETADTIILEIGGHRAPTRIDSRNMTVHANSKDIEEFKRRGIEAARNAGLLVDLPKEDYKDV